MIKIASIWLFIERHLASWERFLAESQWDLRGVSQTLLMGSVAPGVTGEPLETITMRFQGHIKGMKVDTCGLKPGSCQRSMVLAKSDGGEMAFPIRPETRIKPNEQLVTIDTLRVGDFVKVQAIHLAGEISLHIDMLEVMTPQCEPCVERQSARGLCAWSAMTLSVASEASTDRRSPTSAVATGQQYTRPTASTDAAPVRGSASADDRDLARHPWGSQTGAERVA
jgi:hypothetical protein